MKKILLVYFSVCLTLATAMAQDREVSGRVTAADDGSPLPGVNVVIKGTTMGAVTDSDGRYRLSVPGTGVTLVFSFIGYSNLEAEVSTRSVIDVQLETDITQLSEVVVVGYGTQLKQDLTGNVVKVGGDVIQNLPVTSFEQAMQGRASGVLITSQNGKVGQGINIRIRGSSSISAGNEPLYVVDGMIINTDNLSDNGAATNALADLNFNDIQSIEILKDASAAAIYGSRGANGVVMITTKRGKNGKTNFSANFQYGSSKPTGHREWLNSEEYVELFREAAYNNDLSDGIDPINNTGDYSGSWLEYAEDELDFLSGNYDPDFSWRNSATRVNTDWEKQAFQKANLTSFDLTASGGNEKTTFYFSGGYSDQDGILLGNSFKRLSGRLNLDHKATSKLSFGLNVAISKTSNNRLSNDNDFSTPLQMVAQAPITPVRDKEGNFFDDALNPSMFYYPATVERVNSTFLTEVFRNVVSTNVTYKITDNLSVKGEYGFDLLTQQQDRYWNNLTQNGRGAVNGYGQSRWNQLFNYTTRALILYNKQFNEHTVDFTGGFEFQGKTYDVVDAQSQNFPLVQLTKLASAAEPIISSSNLEEENFLSYFGRANYKFKNRYLVGLSGRVDASSKFGPDNKHGFFPAGSLGWIINQEGFMSSVEAVSFLKLRASYGITGNAAIPNYRYLAQYSGISYGGNSGLAPTQIPNPDLSWEKTAQFDIGIDFGFFNDKLTGEIDYYNKQTSGLLLDKPVPSTSGVTSIFKNIGDLENKGFEVVLNYAIIKTGDLSVSVGGNFANNKNKILKLDGEQTRIDPGSSRYINVVMVGQPIGTFYGPEFAGVDPANGDALWYVNDGDHTATTNSVSNAKRIVLGNPTPTSVYGFNVNASYKGFDLSILLQGVAGNKIYNAAGGFMSANGRYEDNQTRDQLKRWQKPGDITDVPQARLYTNNGAQASSRFLQDGSYLRLKTLTLGYNLSQGLVSRLSLTSLRLYVSGQNLLTFTKYTGWDPEVNTDFLASNIFLSNDFYAAPQARNIMFGVKVGF
jgi:TonB-dependent starch-binding outer membrane protein SusC